MTDEKQDFAEEPKSEIKGWKKKLRSYVEERLKILPTKSDAYFPDIEETEKIPIIHDEVLSVQFYKISLKISNDHFGMRLNHKPRVSRSEGGSLNVITDLDFTTP